MNHHRWSWAVLAIVCSCNSQIQPSGNAGAGGAAGSGGTSGGKADAAAFPGGPINWGDGGVADSAPFMPPPPAMPSTGPWGGMFSDPSAPANAGTMFTGTETPTGGAKIVYPLDGSMHATNLNDITLQWQQAAGMQMLYRIRFTNSSGTYEILVNTPCTNGQCIYQVPEDTWRAIATSNRDRDVVMTVAAPGAGMDVVSAPVNLRFSVGPVEGGFYYWSTSMEGTFRLTFGQKKATAFITGSGRTCFGCHSLSRDGSRIAWTDLTNTLSATTDMPTKRASQKGSDGPTTALSPDGTKAVVADPDGMSLRDATTMAVISQVDPSFFGAGKSGYFPEWSPDGKSIAVTLAKTGSQFDSTPEGALGILPFNDGKFGAVQVLVPQDKDMSYYPSWSPDGKWIVFASAPVGNKSLTYANPQARLRLIASSGGKIYELGHATQGMSNTASWPKFTPFSQLDGQLLFVAFSSKIDYGFLFTGKTRSQIWMSAVDLRRLDSGDPSWSPVWLPFQDVKQDNHLPFWTQAVGCVVSADCGEGASCKNKMCVRNIIE